MPGRNIHSLSLSLRAPSTDSNCDISSSNTAAGQNTSCLLPAQNKQPAGSLNMPASDKEYRLPITIFRRGQITPTTPSYFPQGVAVGNKTGGILSPRMANAVVDSPAMQLDINTPESPDEEFGFSLEEFEKRYVPLSHLPTPPLSASRSVDLGETEVLLVDAEFLGPAKHLVSMIPRNASRESPSVQVMADILQSASLRLAVISLACCVLDCLSDQFLRQWRCGCRRPDGTPELSELLGVAALSVSMKFLEDSHYSNKMWHQNICDGLFGPQSLNITERLILADLDYCLLSISQPRHMEKGIDELKRCIAEAANFRPPLQRSTLGFAESSAAARTMFPLSQFP